MVKFTTSIVYGSALVAGVLAAPRPDSAIGDEVAVSAPNGTPITDTAELASQTSAEAAASLASVYSAMGMDSSNTMMSMDSMVTSMAMSDSMDMSTDMSMDTMTMDTSMDTMTMDNSYMSMDSSSMDDSYMTMTTSDIMSTSTLSTYESTSTMAYGSGSSSWSDTNYNSCVQQCVAEFGMPMSSYTPSSTTNSSSSSGSDGSSYSGSSGSSGVTHTIIVAPSQGVLRYVPFATNASVGDTIEFMWGANMHTVTHSSEFSICNKTEDSPFTSGVQNQSFTFTQVVNDTNPTFFYCGVPTHCQKGMFGIINPPSALSADTSIMNAMPSMIMNSSSIAAMAAYQQNLTSNNSGAAMWGSAINMGNMTSDQMALMAENVMYTRTFLAANPEVIDTTGAVDMSKATGPYMVPQDISNVMATGKDSSSTSSSAVGAAASGSASGSAPSSSPTSGAGKSGVSTVLMGVIALGAAFFAL